MESDLPAKFHTRTWLMLGSVITLIGWPTVVPLCAQNPTQARTSAASTEISKLAMARKLKGLMSIEGAIGTVSRPLLFKPAPPSTRPEQETTRALERWSRRYMPSDTLAEVEARAIANEFNESELRGLVAFFSSPLGHRLVEAQPRLSSAVTSETNRIMAPHRRELIDTVRALAAHARPR